MKWKYLILILSLLIFSFSNPTIAEERGEEANSVQQTETIEKHITTNAQLNESKISGSGNQGDPYILTFDNSTTSAITMLKIEGTDAFFEIRDSYFSGGNIAVSFYDVENGVITNSNFTLSTTAIKLEDSTNINITNNLINEFVEFGISLTGSNTNIISGNQIDSESEFVDVGLGLLQSSGGTGLKIDPSIFIEVSNNSIYNANMSIVVHDESSNVGIFNNTLDQNNFGVVIFEVTNVFVTNNTITNSETAGIWVKDVQNVEINANTMSSNNNQDLIVLNPPSSTTTDPWGSQSTLIGDTDTEEEEESLHAMVIFATLTGMATIITLRKKR